jgi:hypothetical protein
MTSRLINNNLLINIQHNNFEAPFLEKINNSLKVALSNDKKLEFIQDLYCGRVQSINSDLLQFIKNQIPLHKSASTSF